MKLSEFRALIKEEVKKVITENNTVDNTSESFRKSIEDKISKLFDKLVPGSGPAETVEGEMVRAINRILFRYYNDGDFYFRGYGKETVSPSVKYLLVVPPSDVIRELKTLFAKAKLNAPEKHPTKKYQYVGMYEDTDGYQNAIYLAADVIYKYVKSKNGKYTPNTMNSRNNTKITNKST